MVDKTDLSPKDFQFEPDVGTSLRDRLRDAVDVIRRPLYKAIYSKKFAKLPYPWVNQYVQQYIELYERVGLKLKSLVVDWRGLPLWDAGFIWSQELAKRLTEKGVKKVIFHPFCSDVQYHFPQRQTRQC